MLIDNAEYLVAIDFETANSHPLSACQIGIIVFRKGEVIFEYESLIKPPRRYSEFNYYNVQIHNIKKQDVKDAPNWLEIYEDFKYYLDNSIIVAHNANFDISVFKNLNQFYNIKFPKAIYYDTVELSRKMLPYLPNHKLNTVSEHLSIDLKHHDAKSDAYACGLIVYKCLQMIDSENVSELFEKTNMFPKQLTL